MRKILLVVFLAFYSNVALADPLEGISIRPEINDPEYDRSMYRHWTDDDHDCQNQRAEVLVQESLAPPSFEGDEKCRVVSGLWYDPYTNRFLFSAEDVDVDHFVPLREAHVSGGYAWSSSERERYANWMDNSRHLIAVDRSANRSKGAQDPANWIPPHEGFHCYYLQVWVEIKREWGLSVDQEEADFIRERLANC